MRERILEAMSAAFGGTERWRVVNKHTPLNIGDRLPFLGGYWEITWVSYTGVSGWQVGLRCVETVPWP